MLEPLFHKGCIFAACFRFAKAKLPKYGDFSFKKSPCIEGACEKKGELLTTDRHR